MQKKNEAVLSQGQSLAARFLRAFVALALVLCIWPAAAQQHEYYDEIRYVHTDIFGSVVALTDEQGNVVERFKYEPYGKLRDQAPRNGPGFTGHVGDGATGHIYMQQRYYSPEEMRGLSVDPVTIYGSGDMRHFNRYAYAYNNPYKYTDPDGRCPACNRFSDNYAQAVAGGRSHEFHAFRGPAIAATGLMAAPLAWELGWVALTNPVATTNVMVGIGEVAGVTGTGAALAAKGFVNPANVRFSQSSVRSTFRDGGSIQELAEALRSGTVRAGDVPAIRLVERDGKLFTLDNRRLEAFRRAEVEAPYRMATPDEMVGENWKFTTTNEGASIRIRGE